MIQRDLNGHTASYHTADLQASFTIYGFRWRTELLRGCHSFASQELSLPLIGQLKHLPLLLLENLSASDPFTFHHHDRNRGQGMDVLHWIAINNQQGSLLAWFDGSDAVISTQKFGGIAGSCT